MKLKKKTLRFKTLRRLVKEARRAVGTERYHASKDGYSIADARRVGLERACAQAYKRATDHPNASNQFKYGVMLRWFHCPESERRSKRVW